MGDLLNYLIKPEGWDQGIYELESYEQYASIPALRSSELKKMAKSPAHYRAAIIYKKPPSNQSQKTFDKGKAFDVLMLHGQKLFNSSIATDPGINKNSNDYKAWAKQQTGKLILKKEEIESILEMQAHAFKKQRFAEIFGVDGYRHRVIVWQCSRTSLWCKAEIDWITPDGRVVDLKSARDAGFWFFSRNAYRLGYFHQGAFYLDGLQHVTGIDHKEFYLAAVEVDPPWESHVFRVPREQLYQAHAQNTDNMAKLRQCFETNEWPGYPDEIMDIDSGQYLEQDLIDDTEGDDINGF